MTHPNVEVFHWSNQMRLEEKEMIGDQFESTVLRSGYHALANHMIETGAVTWTTEDRPYGSKTPDYLWEGTSCTVGAIAVVRNKDEVARYAVQLAQARETALREALALVDKLLSGFGPDLNANYDALRKAYRVLKTAAHKAVEPGMWRPMWTEHRSAYRDVEYLYADQQIHDRPVWQTERVRLLDTSFEDVSSVAQTGVVDEQHAIAWRPRQRG